MSKVTRYVCIPIAPLLKRIRVPFTKRTIPLWSIVLAFLLIVVPGSGAAIVATNQPIFCTSCHEMDLHYATWSQSSHRKVGCEECHVMPGMTNMLKSKLHALRLVKEHAKGDVRATAIQGHVPDANCKRCHTQTSELVTYHGLKITHKAHWDMGVKCTFCHDRAVHGPKWLYTDVTSTQKIRAVATPFKYTPQMATCYACHDGKKAPNTCSTCHVTLGERKPSTFDPAWVAAHRDEVHRSGKENCARCHDQQFCDTCHRAANPHSGDWVARHPQEARKDASGCESCHLAPAEARPKAAKDMAFCRACHGLRTEHKQANWQQVHGRESLKNPAACQKCHTASWCSDCHAISRPHPQEWLARHPAEASRNPTSCEVCHTQQFCEACHQGKKGVPASHTRGWLNQHKDVASVSKATCNVCHKTGFCQSCHAKKAPASHGPNWMSQHGTANKAQPASCLLCHKEQDCNTCHGMTMPHPKLWLASHHKAAAKNEKLCERCHQKQACDSCHKGAFPASHQPSDWLAKHGTQATKPGADCTLCHRSEFCLACHGTPMPHPKGWAGKPHGAAASKSKTACARCHQDSACDTCHGGLSMPHPGTWVSDHGKKALTSAAACAKCHTQKDCSTCHSALPPASHQKPDWRQQHGMAGATNVNLCTLCHGKDACNACHAKSAAAKAGKGK